LNVIYRKAQTWNIGTRVKQGQICR
jgi:hypothetical protein